MGMGAKKALFVVLGFFLAIGVWATVSQARTFYNDYQTFKVMRAWIVREDAERRQRMAAKPQAAPQAAPAAQPPTAEPAKK